MNYRIEKDTMGEVKVPVDAYYGAQTQRSIDNFKIAQDINKMPKEIIKAFAYLKKAAALTNLDAGVLSQEKSDLIGKVCDEILADKLNDYFPLVVWQTGSGTQSNMNVNEVVAYRGHDGVHAPSRPLEIVSAPFPVPKEFAQPSPISFI